MIHGRIRMLDPLALPLATSIKQRLAKLKPEKAPELVGGADVHGPACGHLHGASCRRLRLRRGQERRRHRDAARRRRHRVERRPPRRLLLSGRRPFLGRRRHHDRRRRPGLPGARRRRGVARLLGSQHRAGALRGLEVHGQGQERRLRRRRRRRRLRERVRHGRVVVDAAAVVRLASHQGSCSFRCLSSDDDWTSRMICFLFGRGAGGSEVAWRSRSRAAPTARGRARGREDGRRPCSASRPIDKPDRNLSFIAARAVKTRDRAFSVVYARAMPRRLVTSPLPRLGEQTKEGGTSFMPHKPSSAVRGTGDGSGTDVGRGWQVSSRHSLGVNQFNDSRAADDNHDLCKPHHHHVEGSAQQINLFHEFGHDL
ncbi:hypothetical protein BRADI_4g36496v3 [Brachypodium distachyon]|uniref:Uncharacterized protein n=1 Tax=Brachypodium distachyon TaxID=15368 RepID=A0A2K2CSP5_BRADI|nr:hypothetical protein BRADI_4g36496v3 [Brachypodium distachyon]